MTTNDFDSKDTEIAYKRFIHDYEHDVVMNTIHALKTIGYTVIAPFINESHVQACDDVTRAFDDLEDNKGVSVDDDHVVNMCVLALSHIKDLPDIIDAIKERHVISSHEVKQILHLKKKVTETLH